MKDKNKLIIILCIAILVLAVVFFVLNRNKEEEFPNVEDEPIYEEGYSDFVDYVDAPSTYIMVRRVITKYFGRCAMFTKTKAEKYKEDVLDMLDVVYKNEFGTTMDNVEEKMPTHLCDSIQINSMYEIRNDGFARMYIAEGVAKNLSNKTTTDFNVVVLIDKDTERASILLDDYVVAHNLNQVKYGDKLSTIQTNVNNSNKYYYENMGDVAFAKDMFYEFKDNLINFPELAFEKMVSGNNSNINSVEELKSYINENRLALYKMEYLEYTKTNLGDGTYKYKIFTDNERSFEFIVPKSLTYSVDF